MVSEQALPSAPKSADRMDGAMIAGGDMLAALLRVSKVLRLKIKEEVRAPMAKQAVTVEIDV